MNDMRAADASYQSISSYSTTSAVPAPSKKERFQMIGNTKPTNGASTMNRVCSIFNQILKFIPRPLFEAAARQHNAGRFGHNLGHEEKWLPYLVDTKARYLVRRGGLEPPRPFER
jgi:hypothetical protein